LEHGFLLLWAHRERGCRASLRSRANAHRRLTSSAVFSSHCDTELCSLVSTARARAHARQHAVSAHIPTRQCTARCSLSSCDG
jgi:hypothetical protein